MLGAPLAFEHVHGFCNGPATPDNAVHLQRQRPQIAHLANADRMIFPCQTVGQPRRQRIAVRAENDVGLPIHLRKGVGILVEALVKFKDSENALLHALAVILDTDVDEGEAVGVAPL